MKRIQGPARTNYVYIYSKHIKDWLDQRNRSNQYNEAVRLSIGHEVAHCLSLPHVISSSSVTNEVRFRYNEGGSGGGTLVIKTHASGGEKSLMRSNILHQLGSNPGFPAFHHYQYMMIPSNLEPNDIRPRASSILPDFNIIFDESNTPGYQNQ